MAIGREFESSFYRVASMESVPGVSRLIERESTISSVRLFIILA